MAELMIDRRAMIAGVAAAGASRRAGAVTRWTLPGLAAVRAEARLQEIRGLVVLSAGQPVISLGEPAAVDRIASCRKSFLSALYGIAVRDQKINLDITLKDVGIDDDSKLTDIERRATVRQLLQAKSGVYIPSSAETPAMKAARPARGSHAPGTFWYYNNWDFNVLGTIFEKKTGLKIGEAFYQRIARPINMQDFQPSDVFYFGGPASIHATYHFEITARDLARFGLLYLRHGRWNGKQIVPDAWIEKSSHASEMVKSDGADHGGYEYLWWVDYGGVHFPEVSLPGIYSARGNGAHYIFIIPTLDMVIVHRTDNDPPVKDAKTITEIANRASPAKENRAQFGHLVKLILDAQTSH